MCITEYNEEEYTNLLRVECMEKGSLMTLSNLIKKGLVTEKDAAENANMTLDEFRRAEKIYCS